MNAQKLHNVYLLYRKTAVFLIISNYFFDFLEKTFDGKRFKKSRTAVRLCHEGVNMNA